MKFILHVILAVNLIACTAQPTSFQQSEQTESVSLTLAPETRLITTSPAVAQVAETATTTPTPTPVIPTLTIWLPEPLAPVSNENAAEILSQQISAFMSANPDVQVELRLKQPSDVGGIMSSLISANNVAPGAIPDLTLFRRADLISAAQANLIEPLNIIMPSTMMADIVPEVQRLGSVQGDFFGVPFALDVQHLAYVPTAESPSAWTFETLLSENFSFVFPMGRTTGVTDMLLAQVKAANAVHNELGVLTVDEESLFSVYSFYEAAISTGVIPVDVLEYSDASNYEAALVNHEINAGIVSASQYMRLIAAGAELNPASIPTHNGDPASVVDGWSWAVVTSDSDQQALAMRFIDWMLNPERQAEYTGALSLIPSQRDALRRWENDEYALFIDDLMNNAVLPLVGNEGAPLARLLQSALAAVISGQMNAAEAARDIASHYGG